MDIISFIPIFVGIIIGGVLAWFFLRGRGEKTEDANSFLLIQDQLNKLTNTVNERLGESQKQIHESMSKQYSESTKIIRDVTERLTKLDETNKQVVNFADQLQSLQDVLKNPKQRGVLGEYYLETVLKNVLPPRHFKMQYAFEDGDVVDAVIFLDKKRILPVDSKFSLENYNKILETRDEAERQRLEKVFKQDLKNRIDETAKYIRPKEGTMDFAFMFIPSEAIFYDLLINQVGAVKTSTRDLIEYAFQQKKVIIVSPTSFLAYLQTVLQGLRSLEIEGQATEIIKRVGELGRHVGNYESFMKKLGVSLGTTVSHYNTAHKELKKIDKDVVRIADKTASVDPLTLEKPVQEEE